ncbi:MAG: tRNA(His) guanylyltransferase Thg1 family protein [Lachnospiraceae bacterium]
MKFDELDQKMRVYETYTDLSIPEGNFMIARIDGRNFSRLTKETHKFEAPFDIKFRDMMIETTKHLMNCGFRVHYAYTESDEISLLFHIDEGSFGRKMRKYISILAGEASSTFSLLLKDAACFDCRISVLPSEKLVVDYFRWRNEDANRNALNGYCYWTMRKEGATATEATRYFSGKSVAEKNEYLFQKGINYNDVASWQKRGVGLSWKNVEKIGVNPKNQEEVICTRKELCVVSELPKKEQYEDYIWQRLREMND